MQSTKLNKSEFNREISILLSIKNNCSLLHLLIILLIFMSQVFAAVEDEALQLVLEAEEQKYLYHKEAKNLLNQLKHQTSINAAQAKDFLVQSHETLDRSKNSLTCGFKDCQSGSLQSMPIVDNKIRYLIFVSFSMPKESLRSLYLDSINHNATLVIRGLIAGSFKKTAEQLKSLEIIVQIDPKLFTKYQITKVPTIAQLSGSNQVNTISGNISFNYAKTKLLEAL